MGQGWSKTQYEADRGLSRNGSKPVLPPVHRFNETTSLLPHTRQWHDPTRMELQTRLSTRRQQNQHLLSHVHCLLGQAQTVQCAQSIKQECVVLWHRQCNICDASRAVYIPPFGDYLGELTDELDSGEHIVEFVSGGPKNHAYKTNTNKETCKVRGFTLNYTNSQLINFNSVKHIVTDPKSGPNITVTNPSKICRDKRKRKIYMKKYDERCTKLAWNSDWRALKRMNKRIKCIYKNYLISINKLVCWGKLVSFFLNRQDSHVKCSQSVKLPKFNAWKHVKHNVFNMYEHWINV